MKQTLVITAMAIFAVSVIGCSKGTPPIKSVDVSTGVKPTTAGEKSANGKGGNSASAPPVIK